MVRLSSTSEIHKFIDKQAQILNPKCRTPEGAGAAKRNFDRWDVLGRQIPPGRHDERITTYEGEIEQLKSWINARATWMTSNLPSDKNEFMIQGVQDANGGAVGVAGSATLVMALVMTAAMSLF